MIEYQASLFGLGADMRAADAPVALAPCRTQLTGGAWVDHQPAWASAFDRYLGDIAEAVPWHAERREMYGRDVAVPRLTKFYGTGEQLPHPVLAELRERLSVHYETGLGEPLTSAGLCLYRDGADSVAWHGDTIGRGRTQDTIVAIVSFGAVRTLALRPRNGRTAASFALGHGDLLVMGGSCQRTWQHCVPKTRKPVGPRISIQFRPPGVR